MGKLAIIGLGLIGGSMGLALKRAEPENTEVIGYDRDAQVAARALAAGAVQATTVTLEDAVSSATMVIICTPIIAVQRVLREMAPHLRKGTVVTDVSSTKGQVMRWASDILPEGVHFIGGHPMAGKEKSGPDAADETLFDGRPYCITPSVNAVPGAVTSVIGLAQALGAEPFFLDADEHDSYAAAISHVPLAVSIALFNLAHGSKAWPELGNMAGPAFYDLTRLTSGSPEMSHDIFMTNRDNVLHWLNRYIVSLQEVAGQIEEGEPESLYRFLAEANLERENFLLNPPKREEALDKLDLPDSGRAFMDLLVGSYGQERLKEITDGMEERRDQRDRDERLRRPDV